MNEEDRSQTPSGDGATQLLCVNYARTEGMVRNGRPCDDLSMKRFFVFFLVGPLVLGGAFDVLLGPPPNVLGWMVGLPIMGLAVAFPSATIDHLFDGSRWQLAIVTVCGCVASILGAHLFHAGHLVLTGVASGISAGFCSWMTNQSWSPEQA